MKQITARQILDWGFEYSEKNYPTGSEFLAKENDIAYNSYLDGARRVLIELGMQDEIGQMVVKSANKANKKAMGKN